MFRNLIPLLADRYHVIAPDYPGSASPMRRTATQFNYTFEHLTQVIDGFTQAVGLKRYAMYIFDYGAPVGFRLALAHPERVTAIISQNGNAYDEGLSGGFAGRLKASKEPTEKPARRGVRLCRPTPRNGATSQASPRRTGLWWRRRPWRSTARYSRARAMTKFSSTCSWTTAAMSRSIPSPGVSPQQAAARCSMLG